MSTTRSVPCGTSRAGETPANPRWPKVWSRSAGAPLANPAAIPRQPQMSANAETNRRDFKTPPCSTLSGQSVGRTNTERWTSCGPARERELPPHGRVEVFDLLDRLGVDAGGEVLPAVVGDQEDDVATVQLAGD